MVSQGLLSFHSHHPTELHTTMKEVKYSSLLGVLCYINYFPQGCCKRVEKQHNANIA